MFYLLFGVIGLALGSFVNAAVWRIYKKETKSDNKLPKANLSLTSGRSVCPSCHHILAFKDLIPVLSWIKLKGRCRYCKKPVSKQYPFVEILTATLILLSLWQWNIELDTAMSLIQFFVWSIILTGLMILAIYDFKHRELPTGVIYISGALTVIFVVLDMIIFGNSLSDVLLEKVIGVLSVGGFFWLLYQISDGNWIGGGDVRLGFLIGVLLGWQQGIIAVGIASFLGTFLAIIPLVLGKLSKKTEIAFGPLLIIGIYASLLWGQGLIDWYLNLAGL